MNIALVNIDRLRTTFTLRNIRKELDEMAQCSTARELKDRFPNTFHNQFDFIFGYVTALNPTHLDYVKDKLMESESFYDGIYTSHILNP